MHGSGTSGMEKISSGTSLGAAAHVTADISANIDNQSKPNSRPKGIRDDSVDLVDQELEDLDKEVRGHLAMVDDELDGIE